MQSIVNWVKSASHELAVLTRKQFSNVSSWELRRPDKMFLLTSDILSKITCNVLILQRKCCGCNDLSSNYKYEAYRVCDKKYLSDID